MTTTAWRVLGDTGVQVSTQCLGAMMFGEYGNPDHDDCIKIIHRALDAGINFIDTADRYSLGESEEIIGKALKGRRDDVVVATKFTIPMDSNPNHRGHSRKWVMQEVENSLRRLGTDYIDLYQAHRPDPLTDIDELLGTLSTLVHQGKVRVIGSSTFPASEIVEAQWAAQRRNRERFVCEQPPYSMLSRGIEREVLPVCERYRMGVITWGPLAGGWLSGRYHRGMEQPDAPRVRNVPARYDLSSPENQAKLEIVEQLAALADEAGLPLAHMALAFAQNHPAITSVITGPRTMEQLEGTLAARDVTLSDDVLDRIDEIVPPGSVFNRADAGYEPPEILDVRLRRRA